jgi:hypothetical protein
VTPTISITPSISITPTISITPSETPPTITCSVYEITNNGGTSISWTGQNCITGNATGGTVNGGGTTVSTGCIRDSSFAYGNNGSVTVSSTPC